MEKNLGQVDLFHLQETEIFEDELNFFLSDVSVWEGFGTEKNLYESFSDEKSKPCFSNIIMSFLNSIISQVKIVFFAFFF